MKRRFSNVVGLAAQTLPFTVDGVLSGTALVVAGVTFAIDAITPAISIIVLFAGSVLLAWRSIAADLGHRIARTAVLGGVLLWYVYPAFVTWLVPESASIEWQKYPRRVVAEALFCVAIFQFAAVIAMHTLGGSRSGSSRRPERSGDRIPIIALASCFIGSLPYVILGSGLKDVLAGILGSRSIDKPWMPTSNLGDSGSAYIYLALSCMIAGAVLLWLSCLDGRLGRTKRLALGLMAFVATLVVYFDSGTRSILGLTVVPPIVVLARRIYARSRARAILVAGAAAVLLVVLLQFQVLYRVAGTAPVGVTDQPFEHWLTLGGNIDYFSETAFGVFVVPDFHDFFHESVWAQFLVSPIPRYLWPEKPIPQMVSYFSLQRAGLYIYHEGGNLLPGVVAQNYMSWGWPGIVAAGGTFGLVAARIDHFIQRNAVTTDDYFYGLYVMAAVWLAVSFRLMSPGFLYPVLAACGMVWLGRRLAAPSMTAHGHARARISERLS